MEETATTGQRVISDRPLETPSRYHPALVTLHWLIVLLVLINLFIGLFVFAPALNARGGAIFRIPQSLVAVHIAVGISILSLLVVRFIVRLTTRKPAPADAGGSALNAVARLVHYALYIVLFALTVVGLIFAVQTNRLQRAFFGGGPRFAGAGTGSVGGFSNPNSSSGNPSFSNGGTFLNPGAQPGATGGFRGNGFRTGRAGGFAFFLLPIHLDLAILLGVLLMLHILAALYHQFALKDHLISRMSYGKS